MNGGYFFVYRRLFEHEVGKNPLAVALWVRLLSDASYEDKEIFWENKTLSIKRGQLITSIDKLSKWLGISRRTTKRILDALQSVQQINIKTTNKYTVITIQNYNKYQALPNKRTSDGTTNAQQTPTTNTTKEYNKERPSSKTSLIPCTKDELEEISKDLSVSIDSVNKTHKVILNKIKAKEFKNKTVYYTLSNWVLQDIEKGYVRKKGGYQIIP